MDVDTLSQSKENFFASLDSLQPIGSPVLGIVIPLVVFTFATVLTWWLYRHFSRQDRQD